MNYHILITQQQADQIRGNYGQYSQLQPVAYQNGYIIPYCILDDSEFADIHETVRNMITEDNVIIPEPPVYEDEDI